MTLDSLAWSLSKENRTDPSFWNQICPSLSIRQFDADGGDDKAHRMTIQQQDTVSNCTDEKTVVAYSSNGNTSILHVDSRGKRIAA